MVLPCLTEWIQFDKAIDVFNQLTDFLVLFPLKTFRYKNLQKILIQILRQT